MKETRMTRMGTDEADASEVLVVCIYWCREEIAERFEYRRRFTYELMKRLREIHGGKVWLMRPSTWKVRFYEDGKGVAFKVTSLEGRDGRVAALPLAGSQVGNLCHFVAPLGGRAA